MKLPDTVNLPPEEIEKRSFEIIGAELAGLGIELPADIAPIVKRVIHTTADFEYARSLYFSDDAAAEGITALKKGCHIVTDTQMARSGINAKTLRTFGGDAHCHIADDDVAQKAKDAGCTRSRAAVDKAAGLWGDSLYVVGNAPTALIRICELVREGRIRPRLVVGVPVGFVNVVESKEMLVGSGVPCIVARGRKGGSNVAAAICNALLYIARETRNGDVH